MTDLRGGRLRVVVLGLVLVLSHRLLGITSLTCGRGGKLGMAERMICPYRLSLVEVSLRGRRNG